MINEDFKILVDRYIYTVFRPNTDDINIDVKVRAYDTHTNMEYNGLLGDREGVLTSGNLFRICVEGFKNWNKHSTISIAATYPNHTKSFEIIFYIRAYSIKFDLRIILNPTTMNIDVINQTAIAAADSECNYSHDCNHKYPRGRTSPTDIDRYKRIQELGERIRELTEIKNALIRLG